MISIIICCRTSTISAVLRENIAATIGVDHELIIIDNNENRFSIFEAYQLGVEKSKGSILCFMHDDLFFHTADWGVKVYEHFKNQKIGALGIAGTPLATKMPGSWWANGLVNQQLIIQEEKNLVASTRFSDGNRENVKPVVVLDGIWLCIRKELFKEIKFDTSFSGYHFYDIDICLQIAKLGHQLVCVFDIEMTHDSKGNVNEQWIKNALQLHKKWNSWLPKQVIQLSKAEILVAEFKTLREFTLILMANNYTPRFTYQFALQQVRQSFFQLSWPKKPSYLLYFLLKYFKSLTTTSDERTLR